MLELKKVRTVIVGGGCQAVALATRMIKDHGAHDFIIVDPQPIMNEWFRNIDAQGIRFLRTPFAAHLAPVDDPDGMYGSMKVKPPKSFDPTAPAATEVFNKHARSIIQEYQLEKYRVAGQVKSIGHTGREFLVDVRINGTNRYYLAGDVVVAVGLGKPWMPDLCVHHPQIVHSHFVNVSTLAYGGNACIVGSGLTAATIALAFAEEGASVNLCGRSHLSVNQLETNPDWRPGERLQRNFLNTSEPSERARQLKAARVANVVTPDIWDRLTLQIDAGNIEMATGVAVDGVEITTKNKVRINKKDMDVVVFATGYKINAEEMPLLKPLSREITFEDGLPVLTNEFESDMHGLFFMGKLGEMAGGPLMRNIPGAKYAAKRIAEKIA